MPTVSLRWFLAASLLLCAGAAAREPQPATAPTIATHPLDPLTVREFAALKKLLRGPGGFTADTVFSWA